MSITIPPHARLGTAGPRDRRLSPHPPRPRPARLRRAAVTAALCLLVAAVQVSPAAAQPRADDLEGARAGSDPADQRIPRGSGAGAPDATAPQALERLVERRARLETQRERIGGAIGILGAEDPSVAMLLVGELAGDLPGRLPTDPDRAGGERVLAVPAYVVPLFAQLRTIESRIATVESDLARHNAGPGHGLGIAAFPVLEGYEFVDSWGAGRSGGRSHKGTDILAPRGVPLVAIEDGVIERFSSHALGGLALYLRGDSGSLYYYAHLDAFGPQAEGTRVTVGEVIGYNGDTGNARGTPHLHLQWSPSGDQGGWVNPYGLLVDLQRQRWDPARPEPAGQGPGPTRVPEE